MGNYINALRIKEHVGQVNHIAITAATNIYLSLVKLYAEIRMTMLIAYIGEKLKTLQERLRNMSE